MMNTFLELARAWVAEHERNLTNAEKFIETSVTDAKMKQLAKDMADYNRQVIDANKAFIDKLQKANGNAS